jgi:putative DNA primase/helicase
MAISCATPDALSAEPPLNAARIARALAERCEAVADALLSQPSSRSRRELRFGSRGSFSLRLDGAKRGYWFDHERGAGGDLLDLVARQHGVQLGEAMRIAQREYLGGGAVAPTSRPPKAAAPVDDAARTRRAIAIWDEAERIIGTPAETYLIRRGIDVLALPERIDGVLRWHPSCPWQTERHGVMIALWTHAITTVPYAIHRTAVASTGEKIGRMSLGPTAGCVIRLWPDDAVEHGLVLGEGIETVLGAATCIKHRGALLQPAWAAGDAGHIVSFPVLDGIESITLLVDHDDAGQRAAQQCSSRWAAAGREVIHLTPRISGDDFNDIIQR